MNARTKAFRVAYFLLVTSGLPMLIGFLLLDKAPDAAAIYAAAIALVFPLSLLPGRVGKKRSYPLRFPATMAFALITVLFTTFWAARLELFFVRGMVYGAVVGALSLFALREACLEYPTWTGSQGATIGIVLYLIPGVVLTYMPSPFLKTLLWILAIVFLAISGFYLNSQNLLTGLATRTNAHPPRSLIKGNRVLLIIFAAIVSVVIFFDKLRAALTAAGQWCIQMVIYVTVWLTNLLNPGGGTPGGGGGDGGMGDMLSGLGEAESSPFWLMAEKVMIVVAIVIGIGCAIFALYYIGKLLKKLYLYLRACFERFAQVASEEYTDEQEDLFDLDDIREKAKNRIRDAIKRFTDRPKRWEDMDTRERVRFCVRSLYKKAGDSISNLPAMTIREAAPVLPGAKDPNAMADLYERARYGAEPPAESEAEDLRKAVKP